MKLFALFFLASALIAVPTLAADHDHIASPIAQMLMHDSLLSSVRTIKYGARPNFKGTVKGNFIQTGGKGSYTGTFEGVSQPSRTSGSFQFAMDGSVKYMGLHATYTSGVKGNFNVVGSGPSTNVSVNAYYDSKVNGSAKGNRLNGKWSGELSLKVSKGGIWVKQKGDLKVYVKGKLLDGKYIASVIGKTAKFVVYGSYGGEKFFVNNSASLNVIALGLEMDPMMLQRNYGTVTGTVNGKNFVKKYDMKGYEMSTGMI